MPVVIGGLEGVIRLVELMMSVVTGLIRVMGVVARLVTIVIGMVGGVIGAK